MKIENRIFCVYVAVSLTLFIVVRQARAGQIYVYVNNLNGIPIFFDLHRKLFLFSVYIRCILIIPLHGTIAVN